MNDITAVIQSPAQTKGVDHSHDVIRDYAWPQNILTQMNDFFIKTFTDLTFCCIRMLTAQNIVTDKRAGLHFFSFTYKNLKFQ